MAISIGDEINAATRPHHTTLNRLILHHLPSALPPSTPSSSSPHIYALGLSHILPIYSTFESSFRKALQPCALPSPLLQNLHTPALERAEALKSDLATLLPPEYRTPDFDALPRLREFKQHMRRELREKPHLLIAYTWIFYMALFSGGRYIRGRLRDAFAPPSPPLPLPANTTTSTSDPQTQTNTLAGLAFWTFPTTTTTSSNSDGEDLKLLYKSRIVFLSPTLTPQEREDIVEESVDIMRRLTDIVTEIAETVPVRAKALEREGGEGRWDGCGSRGGGGEGEGDGAMGMGRRMRGIWILLLRYWFPWGVMDAVTKAVVAARVPAGHHAMGKGGAVPVPVWAG